MRVRVIKHPKSSEEDLKKVYFNSGKSDSTKDKSHNREQKEGTPGILVTGHIIGDQPGVNWEHIQDTYHSKTRAEKANSIIG